MKLFKFLLELTFLTAVQTQVIPDTYDGVLTCFNESFVGGPLEKPTKLSSGCYSCLVGFICLFTLQFYQKIFNFFFLNTAYSNPGIEWKRNYTGKV